jgi:hypothetical protein
MAADYTHFRGDQQTPMPVVCSLALSGHNGRLKAFTESSLLKDRP